MLRGIPERNPGGIPEETPRIIPEQTSGGIPKRILRRTPGEIYKEKSLEEAKKSKNQKEFLEELIRDL